MIFSHAGGMVPGMAVLVHAFGGGWIAMKFYTNIHGAQTMNPNDFGDHRSFF